MYDFANSAFATSVLSVIFSVYFTSVVVPHGGVVFFGMTIPGESVWSYIVSSVMLLVIFLAPLLGSIADRRGLKRRFLALWAGVGALATMMLVRATPDRLGSTVLLVFVAILGFEMSLVFYNAFLKDISGDANAGRVSGIGFALGYIGGALCLIINLMMINRPDWFGFDPADKTLAVRYGMLLVGAWWLVFSIPTLLWVKDAPSPIDPLPAIHPRETIRWLKTNPALFRFLISYLIYEDGIQTVIVMASIFGAKALGMGASELAMCYLMIQFVAFVGALLCGRLADAWGHKNVVMASLALFSAVTVWAVFMTRPFEFWILGVFVGLVLGGSQAASRSLFSLMVRKERSSEFFALFSIVGKAAAFMGPLVFGVTAQFFGLRAGVASLLIFFIVGGLVLHGVKSAFCTFREN